MSSPHSDSYDAHARKRVGKACDRCRLKKSKCDGSNPCSRCKADNAICVFGERKKSHDKVYPKGYVEMLEQQQSQLVAGVREMYRMLQNGDSWPGRRLAESHEGYPLTHDILDRLDVLHMTGENPVGPEIFEDDFTRIQKRLIDQGASYVRRRGSFSSDSEPGLAHSESPHGTPETRSLNYREAAFSRKRSPHTPPTSRSSKRNIPSKIQLAQLERQQAELETMQLYQEPWVVHSPEMNDNLDFNMFNSYDTPMTSAGLFDNFPASQLNSSGLNSMGMGGQMTMAGWQPQDPDFDNFIRSGYHGAMV